MIRSKDRQGGEKRRTNVSPCVSDVDVLWVCPDYHYMSGSQTMRWRHESLAGKILSQDSLFSLFSYLYLCLFSTSLWVTNATALVLRYTGDTKRRDEMWREERVEEKVPLSSPLIMHWKLRCRQLTSKVRSKVWCKEFSSPSTDYRLWNGWEMEEVFLSTLLSVSSFSSHHLHADCVCVSGPNGLLGWEKEWFFSRKWTCDFTDDL